MTVSVTRKKEEGGRPTVDDDAPSDPLLLLILLLLCPLLLCQSVTELPHIHDTSAARSVISSAGHHTRR